MKKKLLDELKNKSVKELIAEMAKKRQEIAHRRMEVKTGRVKNTNLSRLSDDSAVIGTLLTQKRYKEISS